MEHAADAGERGVAPGGRQQRDAERNAVGAHRGRQRQAAEIEQVDEIGVGAEPAVELDRIGQHLRGRIGGRRGRQHHRIEIGKGALGDAAQRLQPIERGKGVGRGQPRAGRGDLARHRMDRIRRRREQVADHEIALGDPRPLVEQPRGLIKRLEVEFDQRGAERCPALERLAIGLLRGACRRRRSVGRCAARRAGVLRETRSSPPSGRSRENGSAASAPAIAASAVMASSTVSENTEMQSSVRQAGTSPAFEISPRLGFSPTMLLSIAGTRPRARGIGAERQRHQAGGNRDRRSRARSARNEIGADRIDGDAVGRAHADEAGRELVEIGLADDDGAGRAQFRDRRRILRGRLGERRAGGGGRQALRVDIVLHRDRHAVKRKRRGILRRQALRLPPARPSRRAG